MEKNPNQDCEKEPDTKMADCGKIDRPANGQDCAPCKSETEEKYDMVVKAVCKGLNEVADECFKAQTDKIDNLSDIRQQEAKLDYFNGKRTKLEKALDILTS